MLKTTHTTCPYCGVGCGVLAMQDAAGELTVKGDPHHPANLGRLCSKGSALADTVDLDGRLLQPHIKGQVTGWDEALDAVAHGFADTLAQHGPEAVAFYVSGQLLTEDYYVANKLMKGFMGSANVDTNSRLCMSSAVASYKRSLGSDSVPCCYEDLEQADLIVLVGSNTAWCHPVLFQRMQAARAERSAVKQVVIDPRRTATAQDADLHLAIKPGTDAILFNGLLCFLQREGKADWDFIDQHTQDMAASMAAAKTAALPAQVASDCGLSEEEVLAFYRLFADQEKTVTLYSQGINQSDQGTDRCNSIINCHLLTGRIGRPGMGPFSITGQPNAMGGREVGGLANTLAAHMDFAPEDVDRVQRFWQAERMATQPGLKAVDLFNAVASGRIKAIWIMATNPVVSLPDADRVAAALKACPLVVVSDCMQHTDTTACADILLPAISWGEKSGTVTNSERRISRQRAMLPAPGAARADWWIICQVAQRMGFGKAFSYPHVADIFREHAALSAFENEGSRDFDLGGIKNLSNQDYAQLQPIQWPVRQGMSSGTPRLFGQGGFYTDNGLARFIPIRPHAATRPVCDRWPLRLNTGRTRDHWHTLTRTGKSARLAAHCPEPQLEIHPDDARQYAVEEGAIARISSPHGSMLARVHCSTDQQPGSVFVPMHWNDQYAACGRVGALIDPVVDPVSGQPASKQTPVAIAAWSAQWYGFVLSRQPLTLPDLAYWVQLKGQHFYRYELADSKQPDDWGQWARQLLCDDHNAPQWLDYFDSGSRRYRGARIIGQGLHSCIFISPDPVLPERAWLGSLFAESPLPDLARRSLLAGQPGQGMEDQGPVVCACFGVGERRICKAIDAGADSVAALGDCLQAGTNCGSCIPELQQLLKKRA